MMRVYSLVGLCLFGLTACGETRHEISAPEPSVLQDGESIAQVIATDSVGEVAERAEVLLLERRGVLAGETLRLRALPELARIRAELESLTMQSERGGEWRAEAVQAYRARESALSAQAELLEAADAEGLPYLEALQEERHAVQRVGAVSRSIEEFGRSGGI